MWADLTKRGSANQPRTDQFQKYSTIFFGKSKLKGCPFFEKIANSCIWGHTIQTISNKWECLPIGPKWTDFEFFNNFMYKIKIQRGYIKNNGEVAVSSDLHLCLPLQGSAVQIPLRAFLWVLFFVFKNNCVC